MTNASAPVVAFCTICTRHRAMTIEGALVEQPEPEVGRDEARQLMLARCSCGGVVMLLQEYYPDGGMTEPEVIWPLTSRPIPPGVPYKVAKDLSEARRCFELASSYPAVAMMVRRAVELVCKDHGATRGNLATKLKELEDAGTIDGRLLSWATSLRFLGNDGAHGDNVSRQDAEDGLALAEALVEYVYVLAAKHSAFEQRRAAAAAKGTPSVVPAQPMGGTASSSAAS
ncbi:DUF4145 domain-containing protein [Kitasatospora sp. NPDC057692]|uniref:DUF4145 domain-containing protein n=1 Tax=Kitasatospora sp. NPDC057692 TaxID=3346215 RepID=UPI00368AFFDD